MQAITNLIWTVFSLLLEFEVQVELFKTFMDACCLKVKLIFEKEQNQCIWLFWFFYLIFLKLKLSEKMFLHPQFMINPHFDSYIPLNNNSSLVSTIIYCSFAMQYQ